MAHTYSNLLVHIIFSTKDRQPQITEPILPRLHHRKMTFQQEFIAFLKRHQVEYDERWIWE